MKILGMSRVSVKHQIVITQEAFEKLGLDVGDRILLIEENGKIFIKKAEIK